jgi:glycosyltransferase 2 family protein
MRAIVDSKPIRRSSLFLTLGLAGLLLFLALRGVNWADALEILRGGRLGSLVLSFFIISTSYFLRGLRWRTLLSAERPVAVATVFWAVAVGYLGNNFLPARAGELIRAVMIGQRTGISKSYALATVLTERVMDLLALVILSLLAFPRLGNIPDTLGAAARLMAEIALLGAGVLFLAPLAQSSIIGLIRRLVGHAALRKQVIGLVQQFLLGMKALRQLRRTWTVIGLTGIVWALDSLAAVQIAVAFDLALDIPKALLLLAALGLASAIPSVPGYIGVYQVVAVLVLVPLGFSNTQALVYIVAFQAIIYGTVLVWGLLGLYQWRGAKPAAASSV